MPLIIDLGLKEQANKLGLGSFDPKVYRLVKGNAKTENYSILTPVLLKAGPRRPSGSVARRPGGPRPTAHGPRPTAHGPRRPGGRVAKSWFSTIFLSGGKSTRMHRSASGLGMQTLNLVIILIIIWILFDPFFQFLLLSEKPLSFSVYSSVDRTL